jgi:hypothetical protein
MKTAAWAAASTMLAIASAPLPTLAQQSPRFAPARVGLAYTRGPGADGCPDKDDLRRGLAAYVGSRFDFADDVDDKKIEVNVRRQGASFVGTWLLTERGTVTWHHDPVSDRDCSQIIATAAESIAIVIDPPTVRQRPPPPERELAPVAPPKEPERALTASPPPVPPPAHVQPAPRPGVFEGPAGIGRIVGLAVAGVGAGTGAGFAFAALGKAGAADTQLNRLVQMSGSSSPCFGSPSTKLCTSVSALRQTGDTYFDVAEVVLVAAGVIGVASVASAFLIRTPAAPVRINVSASARASGLSVEMAW